MRRYSWRAGDALESVAARLGLDIDAVRAANPGVGFETLAQGDEIWLPTPGLKCPCGAVHVVNSGQAVASIARILGVSALSLLNANPYIDPSRLSRGEVLIAPEREYCRARYSDSLITLSERYGVPAWRLAALNPSARGGALPPGMRIALK